MSLGACNTVTEIGNGPGHMDISETSEMSENSARKNKNGIIPECILKPKHHISLTSAIAVRKINRIP